MKPREARTVRKRGQRALPVGIYLKREGEKLCQEK